MTNQEISNLITPKFISTLETVLNHVYGDITRNTAKPHD